VRRGRCLARPPVQDSAARPLRPERHRHRANGALLPRPTRLPPLGRGIWRRLLLPLRQRPPRARHLRQGGGRPTAPRLAPRPAPYMPEYQEVEQALARGGDPRTGTRHVETMPATYDVDGILLPRPFKITKIGPVKLFVDDLAAAERFYRDVLGFTLTEEVAWQGERCVFLRCDTEHHTLGLFPKAC